MAVMRAKHGVRPLHEPSLRPRPRSRTRPRPANLVSRTRTRTRTRTIGFMVPMRDSGIVEALHEAGRTSKIEHPTLNIEWQRESSLTSAFEVRCWTFDVFPRFWGTG